LGSQKILNNKTAAMQRSQIYGLLAAVFRQEVTPDLLRQIKNPRFIDVLSALGFEKIDRFLQRPEDDLIEELAVEYARLFLGPGKHISPHESVHHQREDGQWGQLWGKSTVEVKKLIESTCLQYQDSFKGMPDHISVELEFMQQVTQREAEAWETADSAALDACREIEKIFIEDHLVRWIPTFCDMVVREAESPFYREMAALTIKFMEFEKKKSGRI